MTDEQIIKAFEDCLNDRCEDCLNAGKCFYIENSIWGLAKRQQAEIDKLHQTNFNLIKGIGDLVELTRAEAIKEFAEKLKEYITGEDFYLQDKLLLGNKIDNLTKEMAGDSDA